MKGMELLTSAGVVDTGRVLHFAVFYGQNPPVKFLLQQQEWRTSGEGAGYLGTITRVGATPLVRSSQARRSCSPIIARLLVDARAGITTTVQLTYDGSRVAFNDTPLAVAEFLSDKKI